MATARMLAPGFWHTPTCRNFRTATLYALVALGLGGGIYLIETFALASRRRFVENPADVMMRAVGLAHFWVGWLFLFTSPRLRTPRSCANLAFWTEKEGFAPTRRWKPPSRPNNWWVLPEPWWPKRRRRCEFPRRALVGLRRAGLRRALQRL